jgi:hypothetical protein
VFERRFGRKNHDVPPVRMPDVDEPADIERVFAQARQAAREQAGEPGQSARQVIIVTPGRMVMVQPCPPAGSMPARQVASIEQMIPSTAKRNVTAIAYTELEALTRSADKAMPFLGIIPGFAYIGHAVWVFEGHPSALAAGCREADVLIVDGAMVPYLQADWTAVASSAMKRPEIYVHDRATYSLGKA